MRKAALLALLTLTLALSAAADERHQSYISYDDGGTIVRSGDRDVEATRNLPIYPGDEIVTARRGRSEVHLSDGNIIGIDRATALRFRSILDSYEGDSDETVVELRYGKVAVHRTDVGRQHVRLDTNQASYVAMQEAVYSVESDSRGRDRVTVLDGSVEVRTPERTTRLRRGETASVDSEGVYDLAASGGYASDDFDRWFLKRAERYGSLNIRYTDRRVGYWSDDLDAYGRWIHVNGIGWSWRPFVSVGWRPYYNGYWHRSPYNGCLTWVAYDPWGWGPWHYGRWAFEPFHGWVWVPGHSYSPAWVYWMYGPGYVGWAPSGWWDCHRPYYNWAYGSYRNRLDVGFGFHGRIRVNEVDLRPWTFVDGNTLFSNRVDRAALTTDAIKQRLGRTDRGNGGFATVSGEPARFTREEYRDPAAAIRRRGLGGDPSGATGVNTDLTPFIKRDPNLGAQVRDRIVRSRGDVQQPSSRGSIGGGSVAPIGGGSVAPIGRGGLAPVGGGPVAPIGGATVIQPPADTTSTDRRRDPGRGVGRDRGEDDGGGSINRGGSSGSTSNQGSGSSEGGSWRDRVSRGGNDRPAHNPEPSTQPAPPSTNTPPASTPRDDSWRNRRRDYGESSSPSTRSGDSGRSSGDVPSRVIDGIGGARVLPRRDSGGSNEGGSSRERGDTGSSTRRRDNNSDDSGKSSRPSYRAPSSGNSGSSSSARPSSGGSSSTPSASSSRSGSGDSGGGRRESSGRDSGGGGGRIKRDN